MKWLEPEVHPGWAWARIAWSLTMLVTWLPRGTHVAETYSTEGVVVVAGNLHLTDWVVFSPLTAWLLFSAVILGALLALPGRPWMTRLGIALAIFGATSLGMHEGLNFKGYDRLLMWEAFGMFLAPGAGSGRHKGLPVGRYTTFLTFCCLYLSTGWVKILHEPRWWQGLPLSYDMVHRHFGMRTIGIWMSDKMWLMKPLSWLTLVFEGGWPLLYAIRPVRPWLMLIGVCFHVGILFTLRANTFSLAALVAYPILISPEEFTRYRDLGARLIGRLRRSSDPSPSPAA
jgi:hypothetical protein